MSLKHNDLILPCFTKKQKKKKKRRGRRLCPYNNCVEFTENLRHALTRECSDAFPFSPPALSPLKEDYSNHCSKIAVSWSDTHYFLQNEC